MGETTGKVDLFQGRMGCMGQSSQCTVNCWDGAEVMAGPPVLLGGTMRGGHTGPSWFFPVLPWTTWGFVSAWNLFFCLQLSQSPGCQSRLCSAQHSPLLWAGGKPYSLASAQLQDPDFQTVFRDVAFFTAGLVYCVYILVQCYKCLSWFENKKNPIDSVKNFTDKRFPCFSPPRSCTRRAWAHACVSTGKDSSDVGLFLQLLAKCCQGKERELQMVYSHLQIKWLELLWFLADDTLWQYDFLNSFTIDNRRC